MEYPVYCGQTLAGRVYLRENSGRLQAEMVCRRDDSGLFRGWLVGERGELALGVLAPEAEGLCARRLLPEDWRAVLGEVLRGEMRLSFPFRAEEGWRKVEEPRRFFRCSAFGLGLGEIEGALWRESRGLRLLALPFDNRRPFLLSALFCFARIREIDGKAYAVFAFDQEENPVMEGWGP